MEHLLWNISIKHYSVAPDLALMNFALTNSALTNSALTNSALTFYQKRGTHDT